MKPQPRLSHMPQLVKSRIIENLHFMGRMPLRKVSKEFKNTVDSSNLKAKLGISIEPNKVTITIHNCPVVFSEKENGSTIRTKNSEITVPCEFQDAAIRHLDFFASKPRMTFETCWFTNSDSNQHNELEVHTFIRKFQEMCSIRELRVPVLWFSSFVQTENDLMSIVPSLHHETLVSIVLLSGSHEMLFERLIETVQWRHLKEFRADWTSLNMLTFECYSHIQHLDIRQADPTQSVAASAWLLQFLKYIMYTQTSLKTAKVWKPLYSGAVAGITGESNWHFHIDESCNLIIDRQEKACLCVIILNRIQVEVKRWKWEELETYEKKLKLNVN